jgi:hypothetical protein
MGMAERSFRQQAVDELHRRNIDFAVARLESERAKKAAARTGLIDVLGANRVFRSVDEAIRGCRFPTAGIRGIAIRPAPHDSM